MFGKELTRFLHQSGGFLGDSLWHSHGDKYRGPRAIEKNKIEGTMTGTIHGGRVWIYVRARMEGWDQGMRFGVHQLVLEY